MLWEVRFAIYISGFSGWICSGLILISGNINYRN